MILGYLVWTALIAICITLAIFYSRQKAKSKQLEKVPGSPTKFLIGNLSWILTIYSRANKMKYHPGVYIAERIIGSSVIYQKQGMFLVWFGIQPLVVVFKPDILELVLSSSISLEKSFEYNFLHKWLGTGLLTSKDGKWKHRRKLLTPSFHFRILEDFLPVFHQQSLVLVEKLKSLTDKEYVDIAPLIVLCTLDVICETIMGVSIEAQKGSNSVYVQAIHNLADYFNKRVAQPWLWSDFLFGLTSMGKKYNRDIDILHSFTDKVIKEKKEKLLAATNVSKTDDKVEAEYYAKQRKTFLDLLLDMHISGEQLSEANIREEVDTFTFEESQRLFPSVPIVGRKLNEDIHFDGVTIPKYTTIHCNFLSLHRNPDIFPNPEVFDPERFLPENSLKRHPYAFLPFSAGPRNCIGQKFAMLEEKTIVCNILRHFKVTSLDPRDKFHVKVEFTLRPAQEVRMKFLPRN